MDVNPTTVTELHRGTLAEQLGVRFVEVSRDRVVAELTFREALTTVGGSLHGGTLMAFADTVGAAATMLNLPSGATTTTIESKTNFLRAVKGGTVTATATVLHAGRSTIVVETEVRNDDKLVAKVTQTQSVLS